MKPKATIITVVHDLSVDDQRTLRQFGWREWSLKGDGRDDVHAVLGEFLMEFCVDEDGGPMGFSVPPLVAFQVLSMWFPTRRLTAREMVPLAKHLESGDVTATSITVVLRQICS